MPPQGGSTQAKTSVHFDLRAYPTEYLNHFVNVNLANMRKKQLPTDCLDESSNWITLLPGFFGIQRWISCAARYSASARASEAFPRARHLLPAREMPPSRAQATTHASASSATAGGRVPSGLQLPPPRPLRRFPNQSPATARDVTAAATSWSGTCERGVQQPGRAGIFYDGPICRRFRASRKPGIWPCESRMDGKQRGWIDTA